MSKEDFFVMVKPDGVQRGLVGEILKRFENKGFVIKELSMRKINVELASKHYEEHKTKSFFEELVNFTTSGPVVAMKLFGNLKVARKLVGETVPWESQSGSIRGDFSCSIPENLIHCSDSSEAAKNELDLWF